MMKNYKLNIDLSCRGRFAEIGERLFFSAVFQEDSTRFNAGTVRWKITCNRDRVVAEGEYSGGDFAGCASVVADAPGCYQCFFEGIADGKTVITGMAGSLVKAGKFPAALPVPPDFDRFWENTLAPVRAMPMEVKEEIFETHLGVSVSDVTVNCAGAAPVRGILMKPEKGKRFPAVVTFQGAGFRTAGYDWSLMMAHNGYLTMDINAQGIDNRRDPAYYAETAKGPLANYYLLGLESGDPEKAYLRDMARRIVRAIDYLAGRPDWDGKNLILYGGSQGAWQVLAGAALSGKATAMVAFIPGGCNIWFGNWPLNQLSELSGDGKSEALRRVIPYFDGCSFATRIPPMPVHYAVGLSDTTCKPACSLAAYDLLPEPKLLYFNARMGHECPESMLSEQMLFIRNYLK